MGLFSKSKKKDESKVSMPPAPPGPEEKKTSEGNENMENKFGPGSHLSAPPSPAVGSLDDIKTQVESPSMQSYDTANTNTNQGFDQTNYGVEEPSSKQEDKVNIDDESSLFDLSDFNFPGEGEEEQKSLPSHEESTNLGSFVPNSKSKKEAILDNYFITTSQFKTLLEIVDSVKNKVKESSERHLRLLDIKSEEDIEYENLRKDFQYIEDKLYEVDHLIFEK